MANSSNPVAVQSLETTDGNQIHLESITPHPSIPGLFDTSVTTPDGSTRNVTLEYNLKDPNFQNSASLDQVDDFLKDQHVDRGIVKETILPTLSRIPVDLATVPVELGGLSAEGLNLPARFLQWADAGFEGSLFGTDEETGERLYPGIPIIRAVPAEDPGSREWVLEQAEAAIGKLPTQFQFDISPDLSTRTRQYASIITQFMGAAPVEGALISLAAARLAKTATPHTTYAGVLEALQQVPEGRQLLAGTKAATQPARLGGADIDAIGMSAFGIPLMFKFSWGRALRDDPFVRAALLETSLGGTAGVGTVTSAHMLEKVWPDAPTWVKTTVEAGGAILAPLAVGTAGTLSKEAFRLPIVSFGARVVRNLTDSLTLSGIEKSAARAVQQMGTDWRGRTSILGPRKQFELALALGRDNVPETGMAYTTPQLARAEADILETQLRVALQNEDPDVTPQVVEQQEELILSLRQLADFQEGQLSTLLEGSDVAVAMYAKYSNRIFDRRDKIMSALDNILQLHVPKGEHSVRVPAQAIADDYAQGHNTGVYKYQVNINKARDEGRVVRLSDEQIQTVTNAYKNYAELLEEQQGSALLDAQDRADFWREIVPEEMTPEQRKLLNETIRREFDNAYEEFDIYEDLVWNNIEGRITPQDEKELIAGDFGLTVAKHFSESLMSMGTAERLLQHPYMVRLAGKKHLKEASDTGLTAKQIAFRESRLERQRDAITEAERARDSAIEALNTLIKTPDTELSNAQESLKLARLIEDKRQPGSKASLNRVKNAELRVKQLEASSWTTPEAIDAEGVEVIKRRPGGKNQWERLDGKREAAETKVLKAQRLLKGMEEELDIELNWSVEVDEESVLISDHKIRLEETGSLSGIERTPQEVLDIIRDVKRDIRIETHKVTPNLPKIRAYSQLVDDLRAIVADPDNFPNLDKAALDTAIRITDAKKGAFDSGPVGKLRQTGPGGRAKVPIEQTMETIFPPTTKQKRGQQSTLLRDIQVALTPLMTGEGTPYSAWKFGEDGKPTWTPEFPLEAWSKNPPRPFVWFSEKHGRRQGLAVEEGTVTSESNISLVENSLWDHFHKTFPEQITPKAFELWRQNNQAAIDWLKAAKDNRRFAAGEKVTDELLGFEELATAEIVVNELRTVTHENLEAVIRKLKDANAFDEDFTPEILREYVKDISEKTAHMNTAALFLNESNPNDMGNNFLAVYNKLAATGKNAHEYLDQTLRILDAGQLEDGSNPALTGFKTAIAEAIVRKSLTTGEGSSTAEQQARKLGAHLNRNVTLWDNQKLDALATDQGYIELISKLFGEQAPQLLTKLAQGARHQTFVSEQAAKGIKIQDQLSGELAANIGRMLGGWFSNWAIIPVSSLVLTGMGRRYGFAAIKNLRGLAVENLIVEMLLNPRLASAAMTKYPSAEQIGEVKRSMLKYVHDVLINDNIRRLNKFSNAPGVVYEIEAQIFEPPITEDRDDEEPEEIFIQPDLSQRESPRNIPPVAQRAPITASILSQTSPIQKISPQMMQRYQQVFPEDRLLGDPTLAAKDGGIVSINKKGRQLVG